MRYSEAGSQRDAARPDLFVVGMGRMGRHHLDALRRRKTWNLTGIVDPHVAFDRPVGTERHGSDLPALLAALRPAAAIVAVPPRSHDEVARTCLEAGCHVLLEKPICPSWEQAKRLEEEFDKAGLVLFGGHSERFHPVYQALQLHLPRVGEVQRIEAVREGPPPPRSVEGGVVFDLAVHDLDLIARLVGQAPRVAGASLGGPSGAPRACRADLVWRNGTASVEAAWKPLRRRTLRVVGSDGVLEADFLAPQLLLVDKRGRWQQSLSWRDPLESEHAAFRAACEGAFDAKTDLAPQIDALRLAERIVRA